MHIFQIHFRIIQDLSHPKYTTMKKILVPTDFSENAKLALKHAIEIANHMGDTITVLHAYQTTTVTGSFKTIDEIVKDDREQELLELIREMKPLLGNTAHIEGLVKKGSPVDMICQTADNLDVRMIIMGTTGADGMKKLFLGSTASNVILEASKPVLAIPKESQNLEISNITLALDNKTMEDIHTLKPIIDLVNQFNAVLNLLTVNDGENSELETDTSVQDLFRKNGVAATYHKVSSDEVVKGILEFADRENSDLLCLIHHSRGLFQSIFHSSVSEKIAFDSKVPFLVLID